MFLKDKVTPPLLFDLFKSNFWNEQDKKMQVKEQFKFRMLVGNNNVLQYMNNNEKYVMPFIKNKKKKQTSDQVQFLLNPEGFEIVRGDKKLLTQQGEVRQGASQWLVWANSSYLDSAFLDPRNSVWRLIPVEKGSKEPEFSLVMPYGERKPTLVSNQANPWGPFWTKLKASAAKPNQQYNPQRAHWRIEVND